MRHYVFKTFLLTLFPLVHVFSQQKISGKTVSEDDLAISYVLVFNISKQKNVQSDSFGNFVIEADDNDEIRFVKEGYYRTDKIIGKTNMHSQMKVILLRAETLIAEVTIEYKPTGNFKKDISHLDDSRKVTALKSSMEKYMKSPMNEPVPVNSVPKSFQPHNFQEGQVNLKDVLGAAISLITKASKPKITTPDYFETRDFLNRIKAEMDLSFLTKYGMDEEEIDRFLLYAEKIRKLSKKYRKDFEPAVIEYELKAAFTEYSKLNKLSSD